MNSAEAIMRQHRAHGCLTGRFDNGCERATLRLGRHREYSLANTARTPYSARSPATAVVRAYVLASLFMHIFSSSVLSAATLQRLPTEQGPRSYKEISNRIETGSTVIRRMTTSSPGPMLSVRDGMINLHGAGSQQADRNSRQPPDATHENRLLLTQLQNAMLERVYASGPNDPPSTFDSIPERCELRTRVKMVHLRSCFPVQVSVNVCSGKCRSQGRPRPALRIGGKWLRNNSMPFIQSACRCCRPTVTERQQFTVVCVRNGAMRREVKTFVNPLGCGCDRCSDDRRKFFA